MMARVLALVFLAASAAAPGAEQSQTQETTVQNCSAWSVKGMRVGMTLGEFKVAYPDARSGKKNYNRLALGDGWYRWRDTEASLPVWHYVLPERDEDQARILSVTVEVDLEGTTPTQVVNALVERWGLPKYREEPIVKVEYFNRYGFQGEREWPATYWRDEACDVEVLAVEQRQKIQLGLLAGSPYTRFLIYVDSLKFMSERASEQLDAARESVKP